MKKFGLAVMSLSLALGAACSKEETVNKEETVSKEEKPKKQVEVSKTETSKTENPKKEVEQEMNLIEATSVNKRNEVLYENNKGKATFIGETITTEGKILAAIQLDGELKNATIPDINLKFITDTGKDVELSKSSFSGYRFDKDSTFLVYESGSSVDGTKIMRLDYSFNRNENKFPVDVKSLTFKEATGTTKIPAVKMITNTSSISNGNTSSNSNSNTSSSSNTSSNTNTNTASDNLNIKKENDVYKMTINSISIDPSTSKKLTISGKIESKKDMTIDNSKYHYKRPFVHEEGKSIISVKQSQLFASIPVDFSMTVDSSIPFGKDNSSIINFDFDGIPFSFDAAKGKKYSGPLHLDELPILDDKDRLEVLGLDGFTAVSGEKYYNGIQSDKGFWNHGVSDKYQRATLGYTLGKEFKTLKFKLGAGEKFKGQGGTYEVFVYGDDFDSKGEGNPKGTPLLHEQVTSDSPMKDVTVDVSGVKNLYVYYHSNTIEHKDSLFSTTETGKGKVQLVMTDMKLQ
ncbi:NPCBM/NEW2 domain-containing protein [Bacillus thuringiensis]|uniref:NPCBM/NEW2 domain-containing protein n=1 Tax=Bacillus thuringiensis TaxID=1428 RepID=UPI0021D6798F|nr:NPCBM/NEW2 domain-containing protein [Bacillus thuringiensis]MCU7667914.1 NPCBM/NEW2 domain-containing protein [Bacillus thuringiensis]